MELNKISSINQQIEKIKNDIFTQINNFPDNPKIKRINHNCFTIKISDTNHNFSPKWHDFKFQYRKISEYLNSIGIENYLERFTKIISEGKFKYKDETIYLHPLVIKHLKSL